MARAVTLSGKSARVGLGALALARISIGLIFLWAFFDKLFGLGFATCRNPATDVVQTGCSQTWIHGGSPTTGFLAHATQGPFATAFQNLAGHSWVDWLFMLGLLGIGAALTFGIAVRLAAVSGSLLLLLMWAAELWPANNPLLDEHIVYIFTLAVIGALDRYQQLGLGKWWRAQPTVQKMPWLQ